MTRQRGQQGELISIGRIPMVNKLAKKYRPPTRAQLDLLEAAAAIGEQPDAVERAFMARQLVQCTLPHSNPGDVLFWKRTSGNVALGIQPGIDLTTGTSIGYPYGIIPRLLLFWIVTEAVQTNSRRLILGHSLAEFMREVGLDPNGGGKRSDHKRLKDQMRRLFQCRISFQATATDYQTGAQGERWQNMDVAPKGELWWHPHSAEQGALWESWIDLGEEFFEAIKQAPVPIDMRALRALKRSPLALDLYAWVCFRAFIIVQKGQPAQFIAWKTLMRQLGADYENADEFARNAKTALRKIAALYGGLTINNSKGGFFIHASRLAVSQKPSAKQLGK